MGRVAGGAMGMAGVSSTHTAPLARRPCCPSLYRHSSVWVASHRSSLLLGSVRSRRHLLAVPERNSTAHSPTNSGPPKPVSAPWANYSPFSMKDSGCSACHSFPSFQSTSGTLPRFIKQDTNKTGPRHQKYDHTVNVILATSKLEWENECRRLKISKLRDREPSRVCENIVQGRPATENQQRDCLMNKRDVLPQANAEGRKNISAACLKPNSFTEKGAKGNSFTQIPGNYGPEISQGIPKVPTIVQTNKLTIADVMVANECATGNSEISSQLFKGNTMLNGTYGYELQANGKQQDVEINGSTRGTTKDPLECSSQRQTVKARITKGTNSAAERKMKLLRVYDDVLLVDNISNAMDVVKMLTTKYRHHIHACDTEVSNIDVKQETPVDHGEVICFSVYSGPSVDFGNGKSCIWVDVLDGEKNIMMVFAPFFEDPSIKKVWHNYSFDRHVIENYGIKLSGFHADTMHLARLWNSSRRMNGGYSLEALTGDPDVMCQKNSEASDYIGDDLTVGKISMKEIFGKKKLKKDGTEGKLVTIAPVEFIQREERIPWICYSALDSISTLKLFKSLECKLKGMAWISEGQEKGNMFDFYEEYWRPFGNLLVEMEAEGMLVGRAYLSEIEKVAIAEQKVAADKFRKWASKYCADAQYMNVGSDTQIRQLFFGGVVNKKNPDAALPVEKTFKVPNVDCIIEEGKKFPTKFRNIKLSKIVEGMQAEVYTPSGWPSVSGDALKIFAGKVVANGIYLMDGDIESEDDKDFYSDDEIFSNEHESRKPSGDINDTSAYGTAFEAFGKGKKGRDACHAIAALCEICSIDSLISNFILPLQGNRISGEDGRIHCSLNINTETGRLSARRPNLQNPPALEKDRYKIREAFIAAPGNSLIVADYGQLELRILAHLASCQSMLDAFEAGGDFHSRTAMNMYEYIRKDVQQGKVLLEWHSKPGEDKPPAPLLKDAFASERRKAKMLNFSIAYGKTPVGLARDWKVSVREAKETVNLWYKERQEVLLWQDARKEEALTKQCVHTLLGRARHFPSLTFTSNAQKGHIERAAINAPVQGSAADVAMCAMLQIARNKRLKELKWKLLLQVHDEVILEGPSESSEEAKSIVIECMSKPFNGRNILKVDLSVDAKCAHSWYAAK